MSNLKVVLEEPSVELLDSYGTDLGIAEAGGISTQIDITDKDHLRKRLRALLKLDSFGAFHSSPFEFGLLKFKINCSIACSRHLVRHRTASIIEKSTRYTKPIIGSNKYGQAVGEGFSKDEVRRFLYLLEPTELMFLIDINNFFNFLRKRLGQGVDFETRSIARKMFWMAREEFPITMELFRELHLNGYVIPID